MRHNGVAEVGNRWGRLLVIAASLSALLTGCGQIFPASYRFRATVEVQTPVGIRTGSSVYEVTAYRDLALTSEEKPGGGGLRGEAIVIDLPNGPLFVLLTEQPGAGRLGAAATLALRPEALRGDIDDYIAAVGSLGGWFTEAKAELPRKNWPIMVRFEDFNDPESVHEVDPTTFGVRRILLETTRDEMTTGIENRMPRWFADYRRRGLRLSGKSGAILGFDPPIKDVIGTGSFTVISRRGQ